VERIERLIKSIDPTGDVEHDHVEADDALISAIAVLTVDAEPELKHAAMRLCNAWLALEKWYA